MSNHEENIIVDSLIHYADLGIPLVRKNVQESLQMLIVSFPEECRQKFPFKEDKPRSRFMRVFEIGYKDSLKVFTPKMNESERHAAVNRETLTTNFAVPESLVSE